MEYYVKILKAFFLNDDFFIFDASLNLMTKILNNKIEEKKFSQLWDIADVKQNCLPVYWSTCQLVHLSTSLLIKESTSHHGFRKYFLTGTGIYNLYIFCESASTCYSRALFMYTLA